MPHRLFESNMQPPTLKANLRLPLVIRKYDPLSPRSEHRAGSCAGSCVAADAPPCRVIHVPGSPSAMRKEMPRAASLFPANHAMALTRMA